jgi:hypothetical protein
VFQRGRLRPVPGLWNAPGAEGTVRIGVAGGAATLDGALPLPCRGFRLCRHSLPPSQSQEVPR